MEHERTACVGGLDAGDRRAGVVFSRIATARDHDGDRRVIRGAELRAGEIAAGGGCKRLEQVDLDARHQRLRLGVAEPAVEFQHPRSLLGQHQPGVQRAHERRTALGELR